MSIRFCHPKNFKRLIEYDAANNRFNGLVGEVITSAFYTASKVLNLTVEIQADDIGVGVYREDLKRYDGCLGNIQINESDAILQMNPYPIEIEGASQGLIFLETSLQFISSYNKTEISGSAQMLDSFDGFKPDLWGVCLFTWLLMSIFLVVEETMYRWLQNARKKKAYNAFYQTLTHCTAFGAMDDGGLPRRLVFLSGSIFALLVVNYFSSMIKTDLVTIKDPLVFETYDDIIKRGAIPLFMRGQSYKELFSGPDAEPYRKKLWDYAANKFGERRMYVDLSAFSFLIMCLSVVKQNIIVLMDESIMRLLVTSGCSLASRDLSRLPGLSVAVKSPIHFGRMLTMSGTSEYEKNMLLDYARENDLIMYSEPEVLVHVSRDPREQPYNQGLIYTSQNKWLKAHIEKCARRMMESDWFGKEVRGLKNVDLFDGNQHVEAMLGPALPSKGQAVQQCKSKSIVKPMVEYQAVTAANLFSLLLLIIGIYLALFGFLICEILWKRLIDDISPQKRRPRAFDGVIPRLGSAPQRWRPIARTVVALNATPAVRRQSRSAWKIQSARARR